MVCLVVSACDNFSSSGAKVVVIQEESGWFETGYNEGGFLSIGKIRNVGNKAAKDVVVTYYDPEGNEVDSDNTTLYIEPGGERRFKMQISTWIHTIGRGSRKGVIYEAAKVTARREYTIKIDFKTAE
jgi:hypothetical protein